MTFSLLLDDCQKFAFQKEGDFVTVTRSRRSFQNLRKFEFTGQFVLSVADARAQWKRLQDQGAIRLA